MHVHLYSDGEVPDSVAKYELGVMVANGVTVLLETHPLEDIRNTSRIEAVVVGGRWLDREKRERMIAVAAERLSLPTFGPARAR